MPSYDTDQARTREIKRMRHRIDELEAEVERLRVHVEHAKGHMQLIDDRMQSADWSSHRTETAWEGLKAEINDALDAAGDDGN